MGFLSGTKKICRKIKKLLNNMQTAFAMFSRLPMPQVEWEPENMRFMLCFFPFVGAVICAASLLLAFFGNRLGLQRSFLSALLVLLPVVITGGIHLDGFLDTMDALSSWKGRAEKRRILKDPHTGAFAVISACSVFLVWYGAYTQLLSDWEALQTVSLTFILSRALSGWAVITFPKTSEKGTAAQFSETADARIVRRVLLVMAFLTMAAMAIVRPLYGFTAAGCSLVLLLIYYRTAVIDFDGTNGDLAGWFLCLCEVGNALILAFLSGCGQG